MNQMLTNKLNTISIRLTELAQATNISRPTLYKYIEMYEKDEDKKITTEFKNIFDFIISDLCVNRQSLYLYLFNGGVETGIKREIIELIYETNNEKILKKIKKILKEETHD